MELELAALKRLLQEPDRPSTYILGGAKIEDKVPVIENILSTKKADHVLVGGMVGKVFLKADGKRFSDREEEEFAKAEGQVQKARGILARYRKQIVVPEDFGTLEKEKRVDVPVEKLRSSAATMDIGANSGEKFAQIIGDSKTVVASGPMGIFERDGFEVGTRSVLESMANSNAFTVIGGGHLAGYAGILGIAEKFSHVSTAGGAMLSLLAGEELPAIAALADAAKRYKKSSAQS
jgi:phosphoglycerate kinase